MSIHILSVPLTYNNQKLIHQTQKSTLKNHPPSHLPNHPIKCKLRQPKSRPHQPPLPIFLVRPRIPRGIHGPKDTPRRAQHTRCHRVLQPGDKQGWQKSDVVFEEIVVGTLGAVEEVQVLFLGGIGCRGEEGVGCVLGWIGYFCS